MLNSKDHHAPDQTRIRELEAMLENRLSDVRLVQFVNGQMQLEGSLFSVMAEFMAQMLATQTGPANYTETRLTHPEMGELVLTLQRTSGKTPHALRKDAEADVEALITALHDAIASPKGVVPFSAEKFYDPWLALQKSKEPVPISGGAKSHDW